MASQPDYATRLNAITWTEIPCLSLSRVKTFYSTVFSWTYPPNPASEACASLDERFVMFEAGATHGGFVKVSEENMLSPALHPDNERKERTSVRVTISVQSVDEKLLEIEKAGGAVYMPKQVIPGDMGVVAHFTDTEGNVMGVWSAK